MDNEAPLDTGTNEFTRPWKPRVRFVETDERVDTANNGVLGGRLTKRGAEKLRRENAPAVVNGHAIYRMEIEKVGGLRWDRWLVVCYQNRLEEG